MANIWLSREIFKLLVLSVPIAVVPGKECVQYLGRYLSQRKDFSSTYFFCKIRKQSLLSIPTAKIHPYQMRRVPQRGR